jgi:hypothetical protein
VTKGNVQGTDVDKERSHHKCGNKRRVVRKMTGAVRPTVRRQEWAQELKAKELVSG